MKRKVEPADQTRSDNPDAPSSVNSSDMNNVNGRHATGEEVAFRDGFAEGRRSPTQRQPLYYSERQEVDNFAGGAFLGIILASIVALTAGVFYIMVQTTDEPGTTIVPDTTEEPQTTGGEEPTGGSQIFVLPTITMPTAPSQPAPTQPEAATPPVSEPAVQQPPAQPEPDESNPAQGNELEAPAADAPVQ
ncbi:MAG: hypothetical protein KME20_17115 [Kaiparowitsia implicata GSE-PSE-MK54-09C]|nr:hypothetical protein [Kaiparowitsia implicata GSE-PSE-MK54-09C]